jgi:hypothetical protein
MDQQGFLVHLLSGWDPASNTFFCKTLVCMHVTLLVCRFVSFLFIHTNYEAIHVALCCSTRKLYLLSFTVYYHLEIPLLQSANGLRFFLPQSVFWFILKQCFFVLQNSLRQSFTTHDGSSNNKEACDEKQSCLWYR